MAKLIAHYELYKTITHLPGAVIECGVYKGVSLIRFAEFRDILENNFSREIIGFDAFGRFPRTESEQDNNFIDKLKTRQVTEYKNTSLKSAL